MARTTERIIGSHYQNAVNAKLARIATALEKIADALVLKSGDSEYSIADLMDNIADHTSYIH